MGENTLRDTNPVLAEEFDPTINDGLRPEEIHGRSRHDYNWRCAEKHLFPATIAKREAGQACPQCEPVNTRMLNSEEFDWLWDSWDEPFTPLAEVSANETGLHRWKCPLNHAYEASPSNRVYNRTGCPICANRVLLAGFNDFATRYPQLAAEWDFTRNTATLPTEYFPGCHFKADWICPQGHRYRARLVNRTSKGSGCGRCEGRAKVFADFDEWMSLWDGARNGDLEPTTISASSADPVRLLCQYGHRFERSPAQLRRGRRCTMCPGGRVPAAK
ncbi:MAG: zinc-ribbon domain-containing protein [Mycetocola sp.]